MSLSDDYPAVGGEDAAVSEGAKEASIFWVLEAYCNKHGKLSADITGFVYCPDCETASQARHYVDQSAFREGAKWGAVAILIEKDPTQSGRLESYEAEADRILADLLKRLAKGE